MSQYEECTQCGTHTGHAGKGDGSLYLDDGTGPYCNACYNSKRVGELEVENKRLRDAAIPAVSNLHELVGYLREGKQISHAGLSDYEISARLLAAALKGGDA